MKNFLFFSVFAFLFVAASCTTNKKTAERTPVSGEDKLVGNDRDEHGCIGSAGYSWSEVLQDCIRIWESGTRLKPVEGDSTLIAYIVFNADSSKVELFYPGQKNSEVLDRRTNGQGAPVWNVEDDDTPNLSRNKEGKWTVEKRMKLIYKQR